eukprot:3994230-Pyramimonas_sp.AAC.1
MGTAPSCVAPLSPAGHAPRAIMAQAARTARSPTKALDSRAARHFAPPMPTPGENRRAQTRRPPHVRAESP